MCCIFELDNRSIKQKYKHIKMILGCPKVHCVRLYLIYYTVLTYANIEYSTTINGTVINPITRLLGHLVFIKSRRHSNRTNPSMANKGSLVLDIARNSFTKASISSILIDLCIPISYKWRKCFINTLNI